jgi:hypothetical protein
LQKLRLLSPFLVRLRIGDIGEVSIPLLLAIAAIDTAPAQAFAALRNMLSMEFFLSHGLFMLRSFGSGRV